MKEEREEKKGKRRGKKRRRNVNLSSAWSFFSWTETFVIVLSNWGKTFCTFTCR